MRHLHLLSYYCVINSKALGSVMSKTFSGWTQHLCLYSSRLYYNTNFNCYCFICWAFILFSILLIPRYWKSSYVGSSFGIRNCFTVCCNTAWSVEQYEHSYLHHSGCASNDSIYYYHLFCTEPLTYNCLFQSEYWNKKQILEVSYLISSEVVCPQICPCKLLSR